MGGSGGGGGGRSGGGSVDPKTPPSPPSPSISSPSSSSASLPAASQHRKAEATEADCAVISGTQNGFGPGVGFELVFPFNEESKDHARRLSENAIAGRAKKAKV